MVLQRMKDPVKKVTMIELSTSKMAAALLSSTYVRTNQQARLKAQQTEDIAILTSLSVMHLVVFSIIAVGLRFTDTERREYNLPDPKFSCL